MKQNKGCLFQAKCYLTFSRQMFHSHLTTFVQTTTKTLSHQSSKRKRFFAQTRDIINNNDAKETVSFALHLARGGGGEKRFEWRRRRRRSKKRTTTKSNFIKQNGSKTTHAFNTFV